MQHVTSVCTNKIETEICHQHYSRLKNQEKMQHVTSLCTNKIETSAELLPDNWHKVLKSKCLCSCLGPHDKRWIFVFCFNWLDKPKKIQPKALEGRTFWKSGIHRHNGPTDDIGHLVNLPQSCPAIFFSKVDGILSIRQCDNARIFHITPFTNA